jgi:antitoxin (DNA-binding transcriptional repressor) of toxin-antitoxin stability system
MRRYTSSQLRSRLSEVLDAAERGEAIVVERRGTRFSLRAERANQKSARRRSKSLFTWTDPAIEAGQWTWDYVPGRGMRFRSRLKDKR